MIKSSNNLCSEIHLNPLQFLSHIQKTNFKSNAMSTAVPFKNPSKKETTLKRMSLKVPVFGKIKQHNYKLKFLGFACSNIPPNFCVTFVYPVHLFLSLSESPHQCCLRKSDNVTTLTSLQLKMMQHI